MKYIIYVFIALIMLLLSGCADNKKADTTQTASVSVSVNTQQSQYTTPPEFHEHPDTAKIEYPDTTIYYDDGKYIYAYNPKTQERRQLLEGYNVYLSHNKSKFIFHANGTKVENRDYFLTNIYVYDLATKKTKLIFDNSNNDLISQYWFNNTDQWSPDDKYIILEQDSEVSIYSIIVIDMDTFKNIAQFGVHDGQYWLNNKEILFNALDTSVEPPRPTVVGTPTSIGIFNVETGKQSIIKQATSTDDYHCMVNNKNQIIMTKYVYILNKTPEKTYIDGQESRHSYIIDRNGMILQETNDPYSKQYNDSKDEVNKLKDLLPVPYKNYSYIQEPKYIIYNWMLITLSNNSQRQEFFIMDKTNPHSLRKIGDGNSITW